jgi:hypothetical protein
MGTGNIRKPSVWLSNVQDITSIGMVEMVLSNNNNNNNNNNVFVYLRAVSTAQ